MKRDRYAVQIIRIIQAAKMVPNWSITDYLTPIRALYAPLSPTNQRAFRTTLLTLLRGRQYLDDLMTICRELHVVEACSDIMRLARHPPRRLTEDRHAIWRDGLRLDAIAMLGELECISAKGMLKQVLTTRRSVRKGQWPTLNERLGHSALVALAKISPADAAPYFGSWVEKDLESNHKLMSLVKHTDDWHQVEECGANKFIDEQASPLIRDCILAVARKKHLAGLKKWLKSVVLLSEAHRDYLEYQLRAMMSGKNPLIDLKTVLKFRGDHQSLIAELSSLPSVTN